MKKRILALLLASALCVSITGCGADNAAPKDDQTAPVDSADTSASGEGNININVVLKTLASEYWGYVQAGCEAYSAEHPNVKVKVQGAASETSYDEQLNIIETSLASNQYDGFVIAPLQEEMVVTMIAGTDTPVIAVDTAINSPKVQSFVGTGNEAAAQQGGKAAVELAKSKGWTDITAIAISGVQGDTTAAARLSGYQKGVEEAGGTFISDEIQYADAVADKAYASMEAIIQNHPEGVAIIVCHNDDTAIAAARAAASSDAYKNTVFVGFDGIQSACKAILAGEETMSVAQNAYQMGYMAVEACVKAINGETLDAFIDSGNSIVSEENAQEYMEQLQSYLE